MKTMKNLKASLEPVKNSEPTARVLPYYQGPAASAISGKEDSEYSDECSAQKSGFPKDSVLSRSLRSDS